jgi:glycosyltransferase involved in cell wall biosynthesis
MNSEKESPLVTFVVLTYKQDEFVREAILSALAQTYSPLQIIISDDASTDRTASITQDIIDGYTGPHSININVNDRNLGIGAHVNEVFRAAQGDLIILAGGDDISHTERTSRVVHHWVEAGKGANAIYCGARRMDRHGNCFGHMTTELEMGPMTPEHLMTYKGHKRPLAIGACGAYARSLMDHFGELDPALPIEDIPLLARACMLDGIVYIDEDLVDYRVSVSVWRERRQRNDPFEMRVSYRKFYTHARLLVAQQVMRDAFSTHRLEYIRSASRGHLIHDFVYSCCERQSMSWVSYFGVALTSGKWAYPFFAALMDGHPRIHRFLYNLKHSYIFSRMGSASKTDSARSRP